MHKIRIPIENWGPIWRALVAAGPVTRVSEEPIYLVTDRQLRLLRKKKMSFEELPLSNGCAADNGHG
jgi:hypothetical protein